MSDSRAIEAATATLRHLLTERVQAELPGANVTTQPPDKALRDVGSRINLFLYRVSVDGALRNTDRWLGVRPGESGLGPLPLELHFLVSAYGEDDDETLSARLLGSAVSVLHDHPLLDASDISAALPESDLGAQVERVRLTYEPVTTEEMSRLWTAFQTQYRLSVCYQASVVLIDGHGAVSAALPVLQRGPDDRGPVAEASADLPFPHLASVHARAEDQPGPPALLPGAALLLTGSGLAGTPTRVTWRQPATGMTHDGGEASNVTPARAATTVPDAPAEFPAGVWAISVLVGTADRGTLQSNELPVAVAPVLEAPAPARLDAQGVAHVQVHVRPLVQPRQQALLLVGDHVFPVAPRAAATGVLPVEVRGLQPGVYPLRLRVDGVDSLIATWSGTSWELDPGQVLTLEAAL